jgi:hypothetical protein
MMVWIVINVAAPGSKPKGVRREKIVMQPKREATIHWMMMMMMMMLLRAFPPADFHLSCSVRIHKVRPCTSSTDSFKREVVSGGTDITSCIIDEDDILEHTSNHFIPKSSSGSTTNFGLRTVETEEAWDDLF